MRARSPPIVEVLRAASLFYGRARMWYFAARPMALLMPPLLPLDTCPEWRGARTNEGCDYYWIGFRSSPFFFLLMPLIDIAGRRLTHAHIRWFWWYDRRRAEGYRRRHFILSTIQQTGARISWRSTRPLHTSVSFLLPWNFSETPLHERQGENEWTAVRWSL